MNQIRTRGIVLTRVDYGEADRIVTMLTPDYGKLSLMAKGVRRASSKLAGGIELFSVSEVVFIKGKGSVDTLVSTRLVRHYGRIVENIERTMLGYDLLKLLNKTTEDAPEESYFVVLEQALSALDDAAVPDRLIGIWFSAQLLRLAGHTPNLTLSADGIKLAADVRYDFDFEAVAFRTSEEGGFGANDIKFLRLLFAGTRPGALANVEQAAHYTEMLEPFVTTLRHDYLHI